MRVLMVGTGSIGRRHMASLRSLRQDLEFDVLREPGRSASVDEALGPVTVSTSLDEALRRQPQLMVIANPSAMHLRYMVQAIRHGVPFYAEKPVVVDAAELEVLRKEVELAGAAMPASLVGCNLRFLPSLQALKAIVEDGRLGQVVRATLEAGQWLPDWRPQQDYRKSYSASQSMGGGVLFDLIHEVDAARWLFGAFEHVCALAIHGSSLDIETEDCACLLLSKQGGPVVNVQLDYVSRRPVRRYQVVGDRATAVWDLQQRSLTLQGPQGIEAVPCDAHAFDVAATYPCAMRELLDAIAQNRQTSQPLEEGIRAVELVLRARAHLP